MTELPPTDPLGSTTPTPEPAGDPLASPIACVFRTRQYGNHLGGVVFHHELEHGSFPERLSEWMGLVTLNVQMSTPQGVQTIPRQYMFHIHGAGDAVQAFLKWQDSLNDEMATLQQWVKDDIAAAQAAAPRIHRTDQAAPVAEQWGNKRTGGRQRGANPGR